MNRYIQIGLPIYNIPVAQPDLRSFDHRRLQQQRKVLYPGWTACIESDDP